MGIRVTDGTIMGKTKLSLRHKAAPFDMGALYSFMHDWLVEAGFHDDLGSDDFIERYYWQQTKEGGKNIWFWWRTFAGEEKTSSKYFEYHMDIDVQVLGLKDVEVVIKDKKLKLNKGEVGITIKGYMVFDPEGILKKHPFIKAIYETFPKFWLRKEIGLHKSAARQLVYDFYTALKNFFEHYNLGDTSPTFHPPRGVDI